MRRGMRVSTDNRHSGKRQTLLWPNDMHNSLPGVGHIIECQPKFLRIAFHRRKALQALLIYYVQHTPSLYRWHIVIEYGHGSIRPVYLALDQVPVDIKDGRFSRYLTYNVGIPDFLKHGFLH